MKTLAILVITLAAAFCVHAQTAAPAKELTPQQKLMGICNKEATGLKGEDRKKKMSECLADGKKRQQEVMKACAAQNKGKKGDEYKAAQKECLSKS
jgi:hypothetical protein